MWLGASFLSKTASCWFLDVGWLSGEWRRGVFRGRQACGMLSVICLLWRRVSLLAVAGNFLFHKMLLAVTDSYLMISGLRFCGGPVPLVWWGIMAVVVGVQRRWWGTRACGLAVSLDGGRGSSSYCGSSVLGGVSESEQHQCWLSRSAAPRLWRPCRRSSVPFQLQGESTSCRTEILSLNQGLQISKFPRLASGTTPTVKPTAKHNIL